MRETRPTATSLTRTADCGTRSTTLANCAVTVYGWLPRLAPPGSGRLEIPVNPPLLQPGPPIAGAAATAAVRMAAGFLIPPSPSFPRNGAARPVHGPDGR